MEVTSAAVNTGGPQQQAAPPPPSLTSVTDARDNGHDDLVNNKIVTSDCPMEDRGVDLSFDATAAPVKKELENVSDNNPTNNSDLLSSPRLHPAALKVKEEYKDFSDIKPQCQSPSLLTSSPGGRLKIFQSKFLTIFYQCTMGGTFDPNTTVHFGMYLNYSFYFL